MVDIEGNDLIIGEIYLFPGGANRMVLVKYSHETDLSYVFKPIRYEFNIGVKAKIFSWKRQVPKSNWVNTILCIKATPKMIERYIES